MNKLKLNTLVAVLFPVVLALLFIWAIPSATTLKADDGELKAGDSNSEVISVPTAKTNKSLEELTNESYPAESSLREPYYMTEIPTKIGQSDPDKPIQVGAAKVSVKTGVASFDTNDNPGYDSNDTNAIVRSYDQIIYLVSFSIQNSVKDQNYTNIRYRLKATLPNAVIVDGQVPKTIGEIANGTYYDNAANDGSQYSEGIMESTIANSGQVLVPVVVNVFDAKHGTALQPEFEIEIVDAENVESGVVESINNVYDSTNLASLTPVQTTVSSKPSVKVLLEKGMIKESSYFNSTDTSLNAYDVGAVLVLTSLPGRASDDFRGSTFPSGPVTYTVKTKGTYQVGGNPAQAMNESQIGEPFKVANWSIAQKDRSTANWGAISSADASNNFSLFTEQLNIPIGKTEKIYTSQPTGDLSEIGVFDSGKTQVVINSDGTSGVTQSDYVGTVNPYTYTMKGNRTTQASNKAFASTEFVFRWNKAQANQAASSGGWTRYDLALYVDSVSYDGITTANDSSITYTEIPTQNGGFVTGPVFLHETENTTLAPNTSNNWATNDGYNVLYTGQKIRFFSFANFRITAKDTRSVKHSQIFMWDPSGFEYDKTRKVVPNVNEMSGESYTVRYGVAKSIAATPPVTMAELKHDAAEPLYNWYLTPEEAQSNGKISAVQITKEAEDLDSAGNFWANPFIPVTVLAKDLNKTLDGNPLVLMLASKWTLNNAGGTQTFDAAVDGRRDENNIYKPTVFDSAGNPTSFPSIYFNMMGNSAVIKPFGITTKTEVEKDVYWSKDDINIKVTGALKGTVGVDYKSSLSTVLPKGTVYQNGTSLDAEGNALPDPAITNNADGTTTLKWTFDKVTLAKGVEVNFKVKTDSSKLKFNNTGYTNSLLVKTVGEMWTSSNGARDTAIEAARSSSDEFKVQTIYQVLFSKERDKEAIEVGDDKTIGVKDTITYTLKAENNTDQTVENAKILDVLPYDGDSRGTIFNGNYQVTNVEIKNSNAKLFYTTKETDEKTDPNDITNWTLYTSGDPGIANAKAFLVQDESFEKGEKIEFAFTIDPVDQKPGDVLVNNASFNSFLDLIVSSQKLETTVYGRDLTGVAWYDDNLDGLIGNLANGTKELAAQDIPVKLYRTSFVEETYQNELVKESLSGEKFVDDSGNSLIKTDAAGKYIFQNLPEGEYIAEFVVGDQVVQKKFSVTTPLVGDDPKLNSKADQDTFKTAAYDLPELTDLAADENLKEHVHHVTDVNIGLIRLSTIRLFKYETGTAVDANGDGKLSDVEKASGKALADATFDLYKGNDQTEKVGSATTDASGYLNFTGIQPGEYNLVETKAPAGYELIKKPIKVTIGEGNQTIMVYQENDKTTELPQAGVNGPMVWLVGIACAFGLAGIWALYYYYDQLRKKGA